jgi:rhomboid protease GluP
VALIVLLVFGFVTYRVTTETERVKFVAQVRALLYEWAAAAVKWFEGQAPFFEALRARTRFAPVTPGLVIVNTVMFVTVIVSRFFDGQETLVEWGASIGPRTSNGEWWRLVTSLFVHAGPLQLLACLVGLLPIGFVLERFVGSVALLAVYLASGVFAGLMTVSAYPMALSTGASGAICGLYGLAFATMTFGLLQEPRLTIPWQVAKWLAISTVVFLAYNVPTGIVPLGAELIGFIVGALCGAAIARGVGRGTIPVRRSAAVMATALAMVIVTAVPLRGIKDARPDIDRMMATDQRTAAAFRTAATQLALGRKTETAMVSLIEREIIPALKDEEPRLSAGGVVPNDQLALVTAAREYLRLRIESWHLRAAAFRKGSMSMLRQADSKEGAARDVLARNPYLFLLSPT